MKPHIAPLLLDERQAAKALAISARFLAEQRKAGKVPFVKIGRRITYSVAALKAWIAKVEALA